MRPSTPSLFLHSDLCDGGAKPRVALFIFEVVVFGVPAVEAAGAGIAGAWLNRFIIKLAQLLLNRIFFWDFLVLFMESSYLCI